MVDRVVSQHIEEAVFLWILRSAAVDAPHYLNKDLAKLDYRVDAHLDGLRIAGDAGWEICQAELKWQEPGEVFAACVLALDSRDRSRIDMVVEVGCSTPELQRGLISALGWTSAPVAAGLIAELLNSAASAARRIGVAAHAIRREDFGDQWTRLIHDADPRVCARSFKAAAELGKAAYISECQRAASDQDAPCRFWAAWSAARLGDRSLASTQPLRDFAEQPGPFQERAAAMAVRTMDAHNIYAWLRPFWKDVKTLRLAAAGIAASGDPLFVPVLLQIMQVDEAARPAGEAFSMITGVDLAYQDLERDQPEGFEAGPTEDPADENVAMDADENLPWPDLALVEKWWGANSSRFAAGRRYLCGREISQASLVQTLRDGYQRQRAAAALELALLQPDRPLFEVRARGDWQQRLLPIWFPGS